MESLTSILVRMVSFRSEQTSIDQKKVTAKNRMSLSIRIIDKRNKGRYGMEACQKSLSYDQTARTIKAAEDNLCEFSVDFDRTKLHFVCIDAICIGMGDRCWRHFRRSYIQVMFHGPCFYNLWLELYHDGRRQIWKDGRLGDWRIHSNFSM